MEVHLSLPLAPWQQTPQDVQSVERISCVPGSRDLAAGPIFSGHCGDMSEKNVSVSKTTHRAGIVQAALPAAPQGHCHHVVQPLRMFPHHPHFLKKGSLCWDSWLTDSGVRASSPPRSLPPAACIASYVLVTPTALPGISVALQHPTIFTLI